MEKITWPRGNVVPHINPNLQEFEKKVYSQFGEDGVLEELARTLGIEKGTFFEFGIGPAFQHPIEDGLEGNFVLLREKGWKGTFIDGGSYPPEYDVHHNFVSALNINTLFDKYSIPRDLDFMSIDVDGQEFWIWMALMCRPKVMVIEYNGQRPKDAAQTVQFDLNFRWDGTNYYGTSLLALTKLAACKGYTLVWANGVNSMFVADEFVSNKEDFSYDRLFKAAGAFGQDPQNRPWVNI